MSWQHLSQRDSVSCQQSSWRCPTFKKYLFKAITFSVFSYKLSINMKCCFKCMLSKKVNAKWMCVFGCYTVVFYIFEEPSYRSKMRNQMTMMMSFLWNLIEFCYTTSCFHFLKQCFYFGFYIALYWNNTNLWKYGCFYHLGCSPNAALVHFNQSIPQSLKLPFLLFDRYHQNLKLPFQTHPACFLCWLSSWKCCIFCTLNQKGGCPDYCVRRTV